MRSKLYRANGALIPCTISQALPYPDVIKVQNRLLNGTLHNQDIGSPVWLVDVILYCKFSSMEIINNAFAVSEPLRLMANGKVYNGTIQTKPEFEVFLKGDINFRIYKGTFTMESGGTS